MVFLWFSHGFPMVPPWNPSSATGVHPSGPPREVTQEGHGRLGGQHRHALLAEAVGRGENLWGKASVALMDGWWMTGGWWMADGWWLGCGCLLELTKWKARSGNGKLSARGKPKGWWGGKNQGSVAKIKVWRANDTKNKNYVTSMNKLHIYIYVYIYI